MDLLGRLLGHYRYAAIALVTLLTLGIVGAVVLTERNVGNVATTPSPKPVAKGGYTPPPQQQPQPPAPPPDNAGWTIFSLAATASGGVILATSRSCRVGSWPWRSMSVSHASEVASTV